MFRIKFIFSVVELSLMHTTPVPPMCQAPFKMLAPRQWEKKVYIPHLMTHKCRAERSENRQVIEPRAISGGYHGERALDRDCYQGTTFKQHIKKDPWIRQQRENPWRRKAKFSFWNLEQGHKEGHCQHPAKPSAWVLEGQPRPGRQLQGRPEKRGRLLGESGAGPGCVGPRVPHPECEGDSTVLWEQECLVGRWCHAVLSKMTLASMPRWDAGCLGAGCKGKAGRRVAGSCATDLRG